MKTYDLIIPHFNGPRLNALAVACLKSVWKNSKDYRVIFIQNGGVVPGSVNTELNQCEDILAIKNIQNLGFVKATNKGIRASDAPFLVLLNNDTEVSSGWLEKLRAPLSGNVGISGPLSTAARGWQGQWIVKGKESSVILDDNLNLAFFCAMIRRDVIEKVGLLDEGFGIGLGDDDDYCHRVRKAGFSMALVQDLRITHKHRSTFRSLFTQRQIHQMQHKALTRLRSKGAWA